MKKIILTLTFIMTLIFSAATCAAQDVWVENATDYEYGNIEYYVMDDAIATYVKEDYRRFTVSVKYVKNGKLLKVVNWNFYKTDVNSWWYYKLDERSIDNYTPVTPINRMFEICMGRLGWSYRIIDNAGLVRYV